MKQNKNLEEIAFNDYHTIWTAPEWTEGLVLSVGDRWLNLSPEIETYMVNQGFLKYTNLENLRIAHLNPNVGLKILKYGFDPGKNFPVAHQQYLQNSKNQYQ